MKAQNIDVVRSLCALLDELQLPRRRPKLRHPNHLSSPTAPGHDLRYAIDAQKSRKRIELGWNLQETFDAGLRKTVAWYLDNLDWVPPGADGSYRRERLGLETRAYVTQPIGRDHGPKLRLAASAGILWAHLVFTIASVCFSQPLFSTMTLPAIPRQNDIPAQAHPTSIRKFHGKTMVINTAAMPQD